MIRECNDAGVNLIKHFEGLPDGDRTTANFDPYLDPVGIWTVGFGHAIFVDHTFLRGEQNRDRARSLYPGGLTLQQVETLLRADLLNTARDVQDLVTAPLTDNQFAALVSFTFNLGHRNLFISTLLKKVNAGDFPGAAGQFGRWNLANGEILAGLTLRRAAEAALFQTA